MSVASGSPLMKKISAGIVALMNSSETKTTASTSASVRSASSTRAPASRRSSVPSALPRWGGRRAASAVAAPATAKNVAPLTSIAILTPPPASAPPITGPAVIPR